ncbi:phosphoheptose isomerase [Kosmotoga arenicorallina S304]|uniref:Phosphoheptose isomerase n=1 Tax=Kosmotoga arenicorallina S304 TaxID=1453497 RepID=A0A176K4C6_9BACT|nr:type I phosphomannose isomerase catalytic subunit [Kosmotoga arenicorallina]OAA31922.1 phosphoheptose isomerase [Kosmotoga arenicorallina S304]
MILRSEPVFSPRPWGNRKLNEIYAVDSIEPIGEVWLLSDIAGMRTPLKRDVEVHYPEEYNEVFCGSKAPRFPLLVKYISTTDWLSVQVHPDDETARMLEGEPWGKSECWYFTSNGKIAAGFKEKRLPEVIGPDTLNYFELEPGDFVGLPAGLVHALGPNSSLIEVQQASDITYRTYDWGRGRELHVEKARKAIKPELSPKIVRNMNERIEQGFFSITPAESVEGTGLAIVIEERPELFVVIDDSFSRQKPFLWITVEMGNLYV